MAGASTAWGQAAPAAESAATSSPQAEPAPGWDEGAAAAPKKKLAPKAVPALTIAADDAEMGRLKAVTGVLHGQPIKFVKAPSSDPSRAPAADFTVRTTLQPSTGTAPYRDAKLFAEQLHIIAGSRVVRIEDLKDRVVSFGVAGSAGEDVARKAFQALQITVKESPLDLDNALDGAATGDIDAVVVLAPQPFDRLKTIAQSGLHLLSWPDGGPLPAGATVGTIDAAPYPGLAKPGETIRAVAVDAVLSVSAKGAKQPATKRFLAALAQHSVALSKRGLDLLKADLDSKTDRRVASVERR